MLQGNALALCPGPGQQGLVSSLVAQRLPAGEITALARTLHVLVGAKRVLPKSLSLLGDGLLALY